MTEAEAMLSLSVERQAFLTQPGRVCSAKPGGCALRLCIRVAFHASAFGVKDERESQITKASLKNGIELTRKDRFHECGDF